MSTSPLDSMILTGRQVLWARWIRWTLLVQLVLRWVQWASWIQEASCSNYTIGSTEGYWTCWVWWAHPTLGSKILLGTMSPSVLMSPLNPMSPLGPSSPLGPMSPFDLMNLSSPKSSLERWVQWSRQIHWTRWTQRAWGRGLIHIMPPPHWPICCSECSKMQQIFDLFWTQFFLSHTLWDGHKEAKYSRKNRRVNTIFLHIMKRQILLEAFF